MVKRIAASLLCGMLIWPSFFGAALADPGDDELVIKSGEQSDNVILLQMRLQDLGYYNYKITGFFGSFTKNALMDFQKTNNLTADGVAGSNTLDLMYSNEAKRNKVVDVNPPPKKKTTAKGKYGKLVDWSTVSGMWKRGSDCKVVDLNSGRSYTMRRVGGVNHADAAPVDKANNAIFERTFGSSYPSWYRRAIVVYIGGQAIAASTNGEPHGSTGVVGNGMIDPADGSVGQVCFHFLNSRGHEHAVIDPAHQYQVYRAAHKSYPGARSSLVFPGD